MGACQSTESTPQSNIPQRNILFDGVNLTVWPSQQKARMWLEPNSNLLGVLCWGSEQGVRIDGQTMLIEEIIEIGYGRIGPAFETREAARNITRSEDDHCFALMGANIKFGAQCSSKEERRSVLSALCSIMRREEECLWSPDDEDDLLANMVKSCANLPMPEREAGIVQINGTVGMFYYTPPADEVWLQQAMTAEEYHADVFTISAASQTGLIGKAVPKHMSPQSAPLSNPSLKQLRDASHESAKAAADALTKYYAKNNRGIVWQYQRLSGNIACRLFLISVPLQHVLKSSPSASISAMTAITPTISDNHEHADHQDIN